MADHRRSKRFKNSDFSIEILMESTDRTKIELAETQYILQYNTYDNGLNSTKCGKGYGHDSPKFTTVGYVFPDESRKKMSESAKLRCKRDGFDKMSERSKTNWDNPEYRKSQEGKRKGKRLHPPKLSDEVVEEIRRRYRNEMQKCSEEIVEYNMLAKKRGWPQKTPSSYFSTTRCYEYNVSCVTIKNIIENKTRIEILPAIYKHHD